MAAAEVAAHAEEVSPSSPESQPQAQSQTQSTPDEPIVLKDEKMKRIRAAALRNSVAASFEPRNELYPRAERRKDVTLFLCGRQARPVDRERAQAAAAALSKVLQEARCACGSDANLWICDGRIDDGAAMVASPLGGTSIPDPTGRHRMHDCRRKVCEDCLTRIGKDVYCKGCGPTARVKADADAVTLEELECTDEPPVGPPGGIDTDEDPADDGVEIDAADDF